MKQTILAAAALLTSATAYAGGQEGSVGVGVEQQINSEAGGISVNYDGGKFHVGGFFSFADADGDNNHFYSLGARFYYHVHATAMSDFGLGAGIGIANVPAPTAMAPGNRATDMYIEPGFQVRLFLASNVALSFTAGLVLGVVDADGIGINGQGIGVGDPGNRSIPLPTALAGFHYYFF